MKTPLLKAAALAVMPGILLACSSGSDDSLTVVDPTPAASAASATDVADPVTKTIESGSGVLFVTGSIDLANRTATIKPTRGLITSGDIAPTTGPFRLELVDGSGQVIAVANFELQQRSDGTLADFSVRLPLPPTAIGSIVIIHDGEEIGRAAGNSSIPVVEIITPGSGESLSTDGIEFSWIGTDSDAEVPLYYTVLLSTDGGESWASLLSSSEETSMRVASSFLSPSTDARLFVAVSDGVNASFTTSGPFTITTS